MEGSYKIKFIEATKSVRYEVAVESDDPIKCLDQAKELAEKASEYAKLQTLRKNI